MPSRVIPRSLAVALMVALFATSGCRVDTTIDVVVAPGGGGVVSVVVTLDESAARELGDEVDALAVADLVDAGWDVADPDRSGGGVSLRASKAFRGPDELPLVLGEVSGATADDGSGSLGWLRDWRLVITDGFASTTYRLDGNVAMKGDLSEFGDAGTAAALDGFALGRSPEELAAVLGAEGSTATLTVRAEVPGGGRASTTVDLADGQPVDRDLLASATVNSARTRVLLVGTVVLALAGLGVIGFGRWRARKSQRRGRPRPRAAGSPPSRSGPSATTQPGPE